MYFVYTIGMNSYAVINLKTDPQLKAAAMDTADKLGVSLSAVLNNELRRFAREQQVIFEIPEAPNAVTKKRMKQSLKEIEVGNYDSFDSEEKSADFLHTLLS